MRAWGVLILVGALVAEGAGAQSGSVYSVDQSQVLGAAERGVVVQAAWRSVEASWQERATGAALGSAAAYHLSAKSGWSAGLVAGGLGGLLGERVAAKVGEDRAQELLIDLGGRIVVVVQPAPADELRPGEQVYVVNTNGKVRAIRATGGQDSRSITPP